MTAVLAELQRATLARDLSTNQTAKELFGAVRRALIDASNRKLILTPPHKIHKITKLYAPDGALRASLNEGNLSERAYCIAGGEKNQARDRSVPCFERSDGAWFDFTLIVREENDRLAVLAYDFEIRLPYGHGAPFLRFDLNLPDHRNQGRDLRCHLHPGNDDILVPAPLMTPAELLSLFLNQVVPTPGRDAARRPTLFEREWLEQTLALNN